MAKIRPDMRTDCSKEIALAATQAAFWDNRAVNYAAVGKRHAATQAQVRAKFYRDRIERFRQRDARAIK